LARIGRPADYPLTLILINPVTRRLVRPLDRLGVPPNVVTWLALVFAGGASLALWYSTTPPVWWRWVAVPLLVWASHLCDCLDGDLARYSGRSTPYGAALDPAVDRVREVLFVGAVAAVIDTESAWRWGFVCASGALVYYYTADVQVRRLLEAGVHDLRRHVFTSERSGGPRVKYGLYEPFLYGLTTAAIAGFGIEALRLFGSVFWLAWIGQLVKMSRAAKRAAS